MTQNSTVVCNRERTWNVINVENVSINLLLIELNEWTNQRTIQKLQRICILYGDFRLWLYVYIYLYTRKMYMVHTLNDARTAEEHVCIYYRCIYVYSARQRDWVVIIYLKKKEIVSVSWKNPHSTVAIFTINSRLAIFFPWSSVYFVVLYCFLARALTHFIHASFYFHSV